MFKLPNLFGRKKIRDNIFTAKTITVVYNVVDHASLMAAVFYYMVLKVCSGKRVSLVDIRDSIPFDSVHYVWVSCATEETLPKIFEAEAMQNSELLNWVRGLTDKSTFLNASKAHEVTFEKTVIGIAMNHLNENFSDTARMDRLYTTNNPIFNRYAVIGSKWHTNELTPDEVAVYSKALLMAYAVALGVEEGDIECFESNLALGVEDQEMIMDTIKILNTKMADYCRSYWVRGVNYIRVTRMGPEVYSIIRRIMLSNRTVRHDSMGLYGEVTFIFN